MRFGDLFPGAPEGLRNADVAGLTADSRAVAPGFVFFALAGAKADGMAFAAKALAAGAIAVVGDRPAPEALAASYVRVTDARAALSLAASLFHPGQPEKIVAVTGTSGKTSVADFTRQIFAFCGFPAASLGTIGVVKPSGAIYGSLTTPDPLTLHRTLDALAAEGVTRLAMEASSHGLDQRRLDGVRICAAGFTNLSRDHLDYHADLEDYFKAKLRLFTELLPPDGTAVIAADGDFAERVIAACRARGLKTLTVGARGEDIRLAEIRAEGFDQLLTLVYAGAEYRIRLPLAGAFQAENALVAAGLALAAGAPADLAFAALEQLKGAPGRLERVGDKNGAPVFVDYAHKPDALEKALAALRPFAKNRLILVFGCGGDRDSGKRPIMGEIAVRGADLVIVTDDNPRGEPPASIRAQILAKAPGAREIGDRAKAIRAGVAELRPGDALLIAGKGHETGQIVAGKILPFSDHDEARAALAASGAKLLWSGLGLIAPLNARALGVVPAGVNGVSIDTRSLENGDLFFAITGDRADGHDYVAAAFERGAAAAVVDEAHADALKHLGCLYVVKDVLKAMEGLARAARERTRAGVIAVTGSVGKTSTKEALRCVLGAVGATHASEKSFNNHWGVPLMLARLPEDAAYAVFEIGMNHAGEIAALVDMVRPHVAVVTNVAPVHLEHFENVEAIARAKAEIFGGLVEGGVAILNRDVPTFPLLEEAARESAAAHVLTFGESDGADAQLLDYDPQETSALVLARVLGEELLFTVGGLGKHLAVNSLAVLLAARSVGVDTRKAADALAAFAPPKGRGAREKLRLDPAFAGSEFLLIDESYNANPASMRAAIDLLGSAPVASVGRRIAALGDMLELGPTSPDLHRALAEPLQKNRIDLVFAAGPLCRGLYDALPPAMQGGWAPEALELEPLLSHALCPGDALMVKGSNGSKMHALVAALKQRFAAPAQNPEA
ncbi:UDP-N-acetylmuramyl-tripeptide synthetase/UDP-N-acetylmuramoyl-tripeptide--D-alanyl-D-alanine ligase [Rhodoblastus acidophilus]|nr:UDP-N-acetylmuramyl-tripeptide synthetase/UDP-N-acetylmuramoyl-tripeptide--D-alanyl-D-alanine ligase [Rhodoblastus acidophilus]